MGLPLRHLDLFSGIGGFAYAAACVGGYQTTQFVEIDPFCQRVLSHHWPCTPIHSDVRTFTAAPNAYDIITAGFPCQDLSSAGKQLGFSGTRSVLFYEIIRLLRDTRPKFLVLENVANLLSHSNGETFQKVLFQIAKAGYDAEWAIIPASDLGACHKRARWWCVAYATGQQCYDGELAHPARPARATAQFGNCHGSDAANPSSPRPERRWPCGSTANRLSPDWGGYISQPVLCRGDDGLSGRVDRLKSLGNAVVPQVAMVPLRRVRALYDDTLPA